MKYKSITDKSLFKFIEKFILLNTLEAINAFTIYLNKISYLQNYFMQFLNCTINTSD